MRFLTAVEFAGRYLTVRLASVARGEETHLVVKVTPERGPDVDDWPYADWDFKRRVPVPIGWDAGTNPWRACRYSGPPKGPAWSSTDADQIVRDLYADLSATPTKLADLIEAHLDASFVDDANRALLRAFLDDDFDELSVAEVLHGEDPDDTADLTLAAAQGIHRTLAAGEQLNEFQLEQAEVLLKYAPWQFGYWGPFKALMKAAPVDDLADAYADAIARLSSTDSDSDESHAMDIENLDLLKHLFGSPRKKSRAYMARRVRRDLASLAKRSPDTYAQVAARMLTSWDQPLSGGAYAPAYVLLGAAKALDVDSRYVQLPAEMASRRDPHPEIWNERAELVRRIFASVRSSVETLTWAYQVLESVIGTPELSSGSIGMALETTYPPLRRTACTALPQHLAIFGSLSTPQGISFFQNAIDDEIAHVTDALTAEPQARVGEALANVMVQPGEVTDRSARLAVLYMVSPRTRLSQLPGADAAALVALIERFQLEYRSLWAPVAARMTPQELIGVYRTLAEHHAADVSLESIADEVVMKTWLAPDLTLECVGSDNPKVVELGWRLVEANGGNSFFFDRVLKSTQGSVGGPEAAQRIVSRAIQQASITPEAVRLATWALSTKIDRSALAASLSETPAGRAALWEMSADASDAAASTLASATPEVVRAVGDALVPQQLPIAEPNQLALVRSYLRKNPERVKRDAPFGVAALESPDPALQTVAIRQLATARHLPAVWLKLAESGLPRALAAARKYTAALKDVGQTRDAILACLDSDDHAVQDIGAQLFRERQTLATDPQIWAALAGSDDDHAQELVAEAAFDDNLIDGRVLAQFDRRILTQRRPSRRAKELVKRRLETDDLAITSATDERIPGLLTMARGRIAQDREWALMRLAALALHGVPIDGLEFSLTTTGNVGVEDVSL